MPSPLSVKRVLAAVVTVIGAAAATYAIYQAWQFLYPPMKVLAQADPACDLHRGPCTAVLPDGGRITLAIAPRPIPVVTPLRLEVRVSGLEADAAEVEFTSPDMNMGFNRSTLHAAAPGVFAGSAVLPICTLDRMNWRALVRAHTSRGNEGAAFDFQTTSRTAGKS